MTKFRAILVGATVAGAFAASSIIPAHAVEQETAAGKLTVNLNPSGSGDITADGASGNPGQASGYITAYGDASGAGDICANDNGSPADHTGDETCVSGVTP